MFNSIVNKYGIRAVTYTSAMKDYIHCDVVARSILDDSMLALLEIEYASLKVFSEARRLSDPIEDPYQTIKFQYDF